MLEQSCDARQYVPAARVLRVNISDASTACSLVVDEAVAANCVPEAHAVTRRCSSRPIETAAECRAKLEALRLKAATASRAVNTFNALTGMTISPKVEACDTSGNVEAQKNARGKKLGVRMTGEVLIGMADEAGTVGDGKVNVDMLCRFLVVTISSVNRLRCTALASVSLLSR
eukprot:NODE_14201_length_1122_cov_5.100503.p2 GENE.NODE_14201_length_1122_cov_5.100503~~NODE_14201_length_1122_cov_5.100503.p2  ORF type:complete len:173 (+),score=32.22 NODE_14201_length_1122_cov_5.100503:490-1008(+)